MRIQILDEAQRDLVKGYRFYESQVEGVGDISSILFFPTLTRYNFMLASILCISVITGFSPSVFPSLSTIVSRTKWPRFMPFWIVDGLRLGLVPG